MSEQADADVVDEWPVTVEPTAVPYAAHVESVPRVSDDHRGGVAEQDGGTVGLAPDDVLAGQAFRCVLR
ncbi:hypothetical protein [Streptomyces sp. HPF1205]|uniref:hypothetical protein n=1 Tax=Streptomyces sp. HPF1205 TaxID=2873262 RepID=UPI001CED1A1F|nr:hypothetical protein [Streptomyces sp. HPF1205]